MSLATPPLHTLRARIAVEAIVLSLALFLSGCLTVARQTYMVATDERSLDTQADDTVIWGTIKEELLQSEVKGTATIHVFCHRGLVVLAGEVPRGSKAGIEAIRIARKTEGVRKIETYFLRTQPNPLNDFVIKQKIYFEMVADPVLRADQVDIAVIAGHVVLVGVVDSLYEAKRIVATARKTAGVKAVKSFIQIQQY